MSDNFLRPGYGMNTLSDDEAMAEEPAYTPEEDPVMSRLIALEDELRVLKDSLESQGIRVMKSTIDPWRERARRRTSESPYEGSLPY